MRYLPSDSISDEFWKNLRPKIISLLTETRCIRSWRESLHVPGQLYYIGSKYRDKHGEPLFTDLTFDDKYLSRFYDKDDFLSLSPLGTVKMHLKILIQIIRVDLAHPNSRMKDPVTEEDWHTRTARLLLLLSKRTLHGTDMLKSLGFIPLQNNSWVSYNTLPDRIYLPTTGKIPIPTDLGINLIQPAPALNVARKDLFLEIGVKNAPPTSIIALITRKYRATFKCTVTHSISHLRYLYWNLPKDTTSLDKNIYLINQDDLPVFRNTEQIDNIYFEEENEYYGPRQLFQTLSTQHATQPVIHFLNAEYLGAVPEEACHNNKSWKLWLEEFAGVKSYLQIQNPRLDTISDEFKYILDHKPEKVVGLLKRYWLFYEKQLTSATISLIGQSKVPHEGDLEHLLEDTFLPLPRLKKVVEELNIDNFLFLTLPEVLTETNGDEWLFLEQFGVTTSDDIHFYVAALAGIEIDNYVSESSFIMSLFRIYESIERTCLSQDEVTYIW